MCVGTRLRFVMGRMFGVGGESGGVCESLPDADGGEAAAEKGSVF